MNPMRSKIAVAVFASAALSHAIASDERPTIRVGAKSFTESIILGELAVHIARDAGYPADDVRVMNGTMLLWEGLRTGLLDVYCEYTGTITGEILADRKINSDEELRTALAEVGLRMTETLGFNNTYALGMKETTAAERVIRSISDLRNNPDLVMRFSNEFMERDDGWIPMQRRYGLPQSDVRGIEHGLAYEAIDKGVIHVTDLYSTDPKINKLGLRVLEDDLGFFPAYYAVYIYRAELEQSAAPFVTALRRVQGRIPAEQMIALNARVELDGEGESRVAADMADRALQINAVASSKSVAMEIWGYTLEHLRMVCVSLVAAILVAIPLGIVAAARPALSQTILGVAGIIQTVPAIALLVILIQPVSWVTGGIGAGQAVVALFLYSLLPIIRNTHTGLRTIPSHLQESAIALGLSDWARLWRVQLPLASPMILAGIKTAAVINVGFATLGGFISAGGYGEPIFIGITRNDYATILRGAIPAAVLALAVQGFFELVERRCVPRGLRLPVSAAAS
jgi:osmoprotectant transport system permease protein